MKTIDKAALTLIILSVISEFARPIVPRLAYMHPEWRALPHFQLGLGIITGILSLALGIGIGVWLIREARQDSRSPWIWFLFGLVFNLLAVIVYLLLPIYEERKKGTGEPAH